MRLSPDESDLVQEAARREGLSAGAWVGEVAVRAARTDASPLPTTWREMVAALVQLRADFVAGQAVPIVQLGPGSPANRTELLRQIDAATAAAVAATRASRRRGRSTR